MTTAKETGGSAMTVIKNRENAFSGSSIPDRVAALADGTYVEEKTVSKTI